MSQFPFRLPLILDGACETLLMAAGMPREGCAEQWIIEHPEVLAALQREYANAGAQAICAPTFGANRSRLKKHGLENDVESINRDLVAITRQAVGNGVLVGGSLCPTGLSVPPYGDDRFDDVVDIFREQCSALARAGVDFLAFESMLSLWECRAGLLAARGLGLPVFVTITVDGEGRTPTGASLTSCVVTLQELGAVAVGINCSCRPDGLDEQFYRASVCARVPLIARSGSECPCIHPTDSADFARYMQGIVKAGARIVGGGRGTGPEHISALSGLSFDLNSHTPSFCDVEVCSNECCVFFLPDEPGDIHLSDPIDCSWSLEDDLIDLEDERVNAAVVRVETEEDVLILSRSAPISRLPVSILCDDALLLEKALHHYHGRAIVDSRSAAGEAALRRAAAVYGAIVF